MSEKRSGFIIIPRDDVIWTLPPDERDVFLWFIREAAFGTHDRQFKQRTITELRGNKTVTESMLCRKFNCSRKQIQRIINALLASGELEKKGTIRGTIGGTIYHIVNYDTYSPLGDNSRDNSRDNVPNKGTSRRRKGPEENTKNSRSSLARSSPDEKLGFDEFWQIYPRKVGKAKALKSWQTHKCHSKHSEIIDALKSQIASGQLRTNDLQYCPHPTTWLNGERWLDAIIHQTKQTPRGNQTETQNFQGRPVEEFITKPDLSDTEPDEGFGEFWATFPNRCVTEEEALEAWTASKSNTIAEYINSKLRYLISHELLNAKNSPSPVPWLHEELWRDKRDKIEEAAL